MSTHSRPRRTLTAKLPLVLAYRGAPRPRWRAATHNTTAATEAVLAAHDKWPQGSDPDAQKSVADSGLRGQARELSQAARDQSRCGSRDTKTVP